jgi:hypothetical protein
MSKNSDQTNPQTLFDTLPTANPKIKRDGAVQKPGDPHAAQEVAVHEDL